MRTSLIVAFALATATGCAVQATSGPPSSDGTITVDNASTHTLTEVRVAPVDQVSWGPNLLPDVLFPNERITVSVACSTYDVLVSDDRGNSCVLGNLDLCFSDSTWAIDNATLRNCTF